MKVRVLVLVGIVLSAGLIAAGCGGDDSTTATTEESSAVTAGGEVAQQQLAVCESQVDEYPDAPQAKVDEYLAGCEDLVSSDLSGAESQVQQCQLVLVLRGDSEEYAEENC